MKNRAAVTFVALFVLMTLAGTLLSQDKPAAVVTPTTFRLNAEASKVWVNIEAQKAKLREQYQTLESQQVALAIGASIPLEARSTWTTGPDGAITFSAPVPSPTPTK